MNTREIYNSLSEEMKVKFCKAVLSCEPLENPTPSQLDFIFEVIRAHAKSYCKSIVRVAEHRNKGWKNAFFALRAIHTKTEVEFYLKRK